MNPTPYEDVNSLIQLLLSQTKEILGEKLVGFYLDGSLVLGDFDHKVSDIDLVAALSSDMNDGEFEALKEMHGKFAQDHNDWEDRIEVCYITTDALASVKSRTSTIANISPGEPFHRRESNIEWIMNWYILREKSIALFGVPAKTIVEPISKEEFFQAIKAHVGSWRKYVDDMRKRKGQAYAILTMCRALYAIKNGEQVSKKQAAEWTINELPEWSELIRSAIAWRETKDESHVNHDSTFPETKKFVLFVINQIEA